MAGNIMETFGNKNLLFSEPRFYCKKCDYGTCKKSSYDEHLLSRKHNKCSDVSTLETNSAALKCPHCEKNFKGRSGLWKHRKKCQVFIKEKCSQENPQVDTSILLEKFAEIVKDTVVTLMKNGPTTTNNNNTHNKTFNLNVYLNETCKDAIDIGDFVKSIKVRLEDLENTGRVGYVDGVTNIITRNLNLLERHSRPIHCTDEKREILYVKNEGEWIKEDVNKPILTNAIKTIANENIKKISEWKKLYPDCTHSDSTKNNLYLNIVSNSMSGGTKDECEKNYNKIIKNIVKESIVDKSFL